MLFLIDSNGVYVFSVTENIYDSTSIHVPKLDFVCGITDLDANKIIQVGFDFNNIYFATNQTLYFYEKNAVRLSTISINNIKDFLVLNYHIWVINNSGLNIIDKNQKKVIASYNHPAMLKFDFFRNDIT